jgi:hypothetical protein
MERESFSVGGVSMANHQGGAPGLLPERPFQRLVALIVRRSTVLRQAMRTYLDERKKREMREQMKRGYQQMACLNLSLAEEGPLFEPTSVAADGSRPYD